MPGLQRIGALIVAAIAIVLIARANFEGMPQPRAPEPATQAISPIEAVASSEVAAYHASHVIDGNPESFWSGRWTELGEVELRFSFASDVVIDALEIHNLPHSAGRISWYELHAADMVLGSGELDDVATAQRVTIPPTTMRELIVHITDVHPPESTIGEAMAPSVVTLAEMRFFGPAQP